MGKAYICPNNFNTMVKINEVIAQRVIPSNSPLFRRALSLCRSGVFERIGRYLVRRYDGLFRWIRVSLRGNKLAVSFEFLNVGDKVAPLRVTAVKEYVARATWDICVKKGRGTERVDAGDKSWDFLVVDLPYPALKVVVVGPDTLKVSKFGKWYGVYYEAYLLGKGEWASRDVEPGLYGYSRV